MKRRENSFSLQNLWYTLFQRKINIHKNWFKDHSSWAPCRIGMKIEGILKFCFWISPHQGMLSFLCSRIQGYVLSLLNEVDPCVASAVDFVWDTKLVFPTKGTQRPMYCLSKTLVDAETRYLPLEKMAFAPVHSTRKLPHYFQSHTVWVLTEYPL